MEGSILEVVGLLAITFFATRCISEYFSGGVRGLLMLTTRLLRQFPGVNFVLSRYIEKEVVGFVEQLYISDARQRSDSLAIPEKGESIVTSFCFTFSLINYTNYYT